MQPNIRQENGRIWLELDPFYPEVKFSQPNTVFKSWAIALQTLGSGITYHTLMGLSGAAFRFQLHQDWCPSSPHPYCGFNCASVAVDELHLQDAMTEYVTNKDDMELAGAEAIASIDRRVPVVACGLETGLFVGYEKNNGDTSLFLREPYSNRGDGVQPISLEQLGQIPGEMRIFHTIPAKPDRDILQRALKRSINLATHGPVEEYALGFVAIRNWISDLCDEDRIKELAEINGFANLSNANAHIYHCLIDARQAAAEFLRSISPMLSDQEQVLTIANQYAELVNVLRKAFGHVVWSWQIEKENAEWDKINRQHQADALSEFFELEHNTIQALTAITV